ncbi:gliding motility-associated C-terminal domain-containing protein [Aureispira sp. CCB-E]|uniref:Ig-like domain-containing protein n=1 Tax=Aureispira sp. CCB-E TaxID=3051121 RepID=UPI002869277A|nr:gliding motility-associated C-terminal domain-containing protein [Aureispira sp. CCB-E]WMX15617.1 gliding motility-associated C-terminal domain-containing protein [Aureispira sp. CCB-E]
MRKVLRIPILVLMLGLLIQHAQAQTNCGDIIYVSPTGLSTAPGTIGSPTDLETALTMVTPTKHNIKVLNGIYSFSNTLNIPTSAVLDGGYEIVAGEWVKNSSLLTRLDINAPFTTSAGVGHYIAVRLDGVTDVYIKDISIVNTRNASGTTGNRGRTVYGIHVANSTNFFFSRLDITTRDASAGANGATGAAGLNGSNGRSGHGGDDDGSSCGGAGGVDDGQGGNGAGGGGNGGTGAVTCNGATNGSVGVNSGIFRAGGGGGGGGAGGTDSGADGRPGGRGGNGGAGAAGGNNGNGGTTPSSCAGNNGGSGANGAVGANGADANTPPPAVTFAQFFLPATQAPQGADGAGGGGGGGAGGGGGQEDDGSFGCFADDGSGAGGGGGGGGGQGGQGGFGGFGGGGSFGIYAQMGNTNPNLNDIAITTGAFGNGGARGLGGAPGLGGLGGARGTGSGGDCSEVGCGGTGGRGGNGGRGGRGQAGRPGVSVPVQGTTRNGTTIPNPREITASMFGGCTNSEIVITKDGGTWGSPPNSIFINDLTASTSSYNTNSPTAIVSYGATGHYDLVVDGVTYTSFIYIRDTRALPTFDPAMSPTICEGQTFTMNTPVTAAAYEWILFEGANNTSNPIGIYNTKVASFPTPVTGATVNYHLRLRVRDDCCGWSAPVYFDFDAIPTSAGPSVTLDTVCAGESASITVTGSGTLNWFSDALGQVNIATGPAPTLTLNTPILNQNTVFYAGQSIGSCLGPLTSAEVIVNQLPNQPSTTPIEVCSGEDVVLTATGSGVGDLVFYDAALNEVGRTTMSLAVPNASLNLGPLAVGSYSYYTREDNGTCVSPLNLIGVTVNALPTAPIATGTTICAGNSVSLSANAAGTINWYSDAALTNLLATGSTYTTGNLMTTTSYFVTQADANSCESSATTVTVTVTPSPTAPTAAGTAICSGNTATLTATGAGGMLTWYNDATGTTVLGNGASFTTPTLTQNTTYYVQEMNTTTGCMSTLTAVVVTVNPLPTMPSSGTSVMVCAGEDVILTAVGSGTGDLVFYDNTPTEIGRITMSGAPTANYNAGALATGNYNFSVREDNGTCLSAATAISVTVNALPTAPTAAGTSICSGNNATLMANTTGTANWYSDAALTNLIHTGSVYPTGNLNISTDFYVTQVDNNGCESPATTVTVTVNSNPTAPTGTPDTICAGATATLMASGAGGTINWYSDASATLQIGTGTSFTTNVLAQSTTYYAQEVSADGCLSPLTAITAEVNALPNTPSANTITVCQGQDVILSATGSGSGDLVFYNNSNTEIGRVTMAGNPNATFNLGALAAGNYVYYAAEDNSNCTSGLVAIGVSVNALPTAPVVADVTICAGTTASLTAGSTVNWYSDAALSNLLATSNTFTTSTLTTTTNYYATTVDANGCTSLSDTVTVTVDLLPAIPTTMPDTTCEGNAATLMATGSGGTINWYSDATGMTVLTTGTTLNLPIVNQTTTYYVNETNSTTGCVSSMGMATVVVHPNPNPPSASNIVICSGADVILTATGSGTGDLVFYNTSNTEIGRFTMSSGNATGTFNAGPLAVGNYVYFVAEDAGDCISTLTSINVEVRQLPAAPTAFNDSPVCEGESVFVQANTIVGANYSWTGPNGFSTTLQNFSLNNVTAAQAGTYNVAVTLNGCTSNSTPTTVTVNPRPVLNPLTSNSPLCELDALDITTTPVAGATYAWTGPNGFAATTQNVNIPSVSETDHQGFYTLIATDANGCASLPLSTLVMITALPDAGMASNNSPVCVGEEVKLQVPEIFGATYAWTGPNGFTSTNRTPNFNATIGDTGTYSVVVTVNNCSSTYTTEVEIAPSPSIVMMPDTTITLGTLLELSVTGGVTYEWIPATHLNNATIPNPIFTAPGVGTYTYVVKGYNALGCSSMSPKLLITVEQPAVEDLKIVDLFTPNGDGVNDYWPVDFLQDPAIGPYTLQIVSRGGMEVLNTQNYQNDWYGTYNGKDLPDGTYWYIIRLENDDTIIKGAVTIKR